MVACKLKPEGRYHVMSAISWRIAPPRIKTAQKLPLDAHEVNWFAYLSKTAAGVVKPHVVPKLRIKVHEAVTTATLLSEIAASMTRRNVENKRSKLLAHQNLALVSTSRRPGLPIFFSCLLGDISDTLEAPYIRLTHLVNRASDFGSDSDRRKPC